jgi:3-keto-disaccharide hydrolase
MSSRMTRFILSATAIALAAFPGSLWSSRAVHAQLTPAGKYPVHDPDPSHPPVITPGTASTQEQPGRPPSDAVVLFDGKDLSRWARGSRPGGARAGAAPPAWKVENGYMEVVPGTGDIFTKEKFADSQIHVEWATPSVVRGRGQGRGNSGVFLLGHCEIQVLDSYNNPTYANGQAAAIYGAYPPLVNASRRPGEWQTYDIVYDAPRFDAQRKLIQAADVTVFHNGVLVQNHVSLPGRAVECAIGLQDHHNPVRFRNIWVRRLKGSGQP